MYKVLSGLVEINPRTDIPADASTSMKVSFIPMSDVTEYGDWIGNRERALGSVRNGFTAFADGDVLVAKITPCFENGKGAHVIGLTNGIGFGSTEFHVLRARDGVSQRFIHHVAQSTNLRRTAEAFMSGSAGQRRVPSDFFEHYLVPDISFEEQDVLGKILDTLDTTIHQTEAIIEKLKLVKQGLLHDLLTRGIDANGELRPPQSQAPHLYKDSPLGWVPNEWELAPLLDRVDLAQGQVDPKMEPYRNWILIAPDHIESGTGRLLGEVTALDQGAISGKYLCKPGDVIYSKIRPYLRKAIIVEKYALCSADMYPFTSHDSVNPQFLLSLLLGDAFSRFAESVSMRTGMPKINREELAEYRVAWPCRKEQDAITDCLMSMVHKQEAALMELTKLVELRGGLMEDLLTGRVRVTPLLNS